MVKAIFFIAYTSVNEKLILLLVTAQAKLYLKAVR